MPRVKLAIVGMGNVGRTLAQGLNYYSNKMNSVGLWHKSVSGFSPSDVKIVAAFDIDPVKVGKRISEITNDNSKTTNHDSGISVSPGLLDEDNNSLGYKPQSVSTHEVAKVLSSSGAEIILNVISSGMDKTSRQYAKVALQNGISFINATPSKLASDTLLSKQFRNEKLVIAGDDLLSQFGGTAFHKGMIDFMVERGIHVSKSYQLDVGGSDETKRTMNEEIRMMKREMKTASIDLEAPYKFESVAGTTEFADFLNNSRSSYYWMSGDGFMGSKIVMDLTLQTNDAANAGNVLLDIIRAVASRNAVKGIEAICAYGFKSPPKKAGIRSAYSNFVKSFSCK